jgi:3-hydroxybutyryl-CoA dehydrogenase
MRVDEIRKVLVLGTGMMGPGLALLFAKAGFQTTMWGPTEVDAAAGVRNFQSNMGDLLREGILSEDDARRVSSRITVDHLFERAAERSDFVVEAVIEDLEIKQAIFARLEEHCPPHAILASNTSTLLPSDLSSQMRNRERMLVAHFWNPAHLVPLVEVCGSPATSQESIDVTMHMLRILGKEPVLMKKEILGFLGNRLMHALNREAISLVEKGVADPEDIDRVVQASFGPRFAYLGPLEYLDFVGLDHVARIQAYLYGDLDNTPGQQRLILEKRDCGEVGVKAGKGLFDWTSRDPEGPRLRRDQEFLRRIKESRAKAVAEGLRV